jgi:type II secretory ATPase GspE/PulE/Tfp pilus assembly ATPase PilB-like protein
MTSGNGDYDVQQKFWDAASGTLGLPLTRVGGPINTPLRDRLAIFQNGALFVARPYLKDQLVKNLVARIRSRAEGGSDALLSPLSESMIPVDEDKIAKLYDQSHRDHALENSNEVIKKIHEIFNAAATNRATDVSFFIIDNMGTIDFRMDGRLINMPDLRVPPDVMKAMNNVLFQRATNASGNLSDTTAQDAQLVNSQKFPLPAGIESIRIHWEPTAYGGSFQGMDTSIRFNLVDPAEDYSTDLSALGYAPIHVDILKRAAEAPKRAVIFCGPMGSGKTTGLARWLNYVAELFAFELKIITLEDPVERRIRAARQINLPHFPDAAEKLIAMKRKLADVLRMDGNIFLISELRDAEVTQRALESVSTGHGMVSSIHTESAIGFFDRLRFFNVPSWMYSQAHYFGAIACQRLLPRLCPSCSRPLDQAGLEAHHMAQIRGLRLDETRLRFRNRRGCAELPAEKRNPRCRAGYDGRVLIAEVIEPTEQFMDFVAAGDHRNAQRHWLEQGGMSLGMHALRRALAGEIHLPDAKAATIRLEPELMDIGRHHFEGA